MDKIERAIRLAQKDVDQSEMKKIKDSGNWPQIERRIRLVCLLASEELMSFCVDEARILYGHSNDDVSLAYRYIASEILMIIANKV